MLQFFKKYQKDQFLTHFVHVKAKYSFPQNSVLKNFFQNVSFCQISRKSNERIPISVSFKWILRGKKKHEFMGPFKLTSGPN